jgi:hypothetical protein
MFSSMLISLTFSNTIHYSGVIHTYARACVPTCVCIYIGRNRAIKRRGAVNLGKDLILALLYGVEKRLSFKRHSVLC